MVIKKNRFYLDNLYRKKTINTKYLISWCNKYLNWVYAKNTL